MLRLLRWFALPSYFVGAASSMGLLALDEFYTHNSCRCRLSVHKVLKQDVPVKHIQVCIHQIGGQRHAAMLAYHLEGDLEVAQGFQTAGVEQQLLATGVQTNVVHILYHA